MVKGINILGKSNQKLFDERHDKNTVVEIDLSNESEGKLIGSLKIENFKCLQKINLSLNQLTKLDIHNCPKLEEINCSRNMLTSLKITGCPNLIKLNCSKNPLTNLDFLSRLNKENLTVLNLKDNNFSQRDLSCFSEFINLTSLLIGSDEMRVSGRLGNRSYNRFFGSLQSLQNLTKLEKLDISGTDVDSGLNYLPKENLKKFYFSTNGRSDAKVKKIEKGVRNLTSNYWEELGVRLMIDDDESKLKERNKSFETNKLTNNDEESIVDIISLTETSSSTKSLEEKKPNSIAESRVSLPRSPEGTNSVKSWYTIVDLLENLINCQKELQQIKKAELEALIKVNKNKLGGKVEETLLDNLLETQDEVIKVTDDKFVQRRSERIGKNKAILKEKLTDEEIKKLLDKQVEVSELEKRIEEGEFQLNIRDSSSSLQQQMEIERSSSFSSERRNSPEKHYQAQVEQLNQR